MPVSGKAESDWQNASATLDQRVFHTLLNWAVRNRASDILLCSDKPVWASCNGEYRALSVRSVATWELAELLDAIHIKSASARLLSGQDMDFTYEFKVSRNQRLRFRVNAVAVTGSDVNARGIALTIRVIPGMLPTVEELDVPETLLDIARHGAQGLILVCGATGSGKSSLLAALLSYTLRHPPGRYIVCYESPIEFNLSLLPDAVGVVAQSEIPRDLPSFAHSVRNALRRSPDIILIGEARDRETMAGLVRAAQTGHLVYSTVHTTGVVAAIPRMADEFPAGERYSITVKLLDAMRMIVFQQLVKAVDGGRIALREYLSFSPELRESLLSGVAGGDGLQAALSDAMRRHGHSLYQDCHQKYARGQVSVETLNRTRREHADGE